MGGICSTHRTDENLIQNFSLKREEERHFGDAGAG
jgi:hypothetical protein